MGEYVKYRGAHVKIGTCELMYYTTYGKYKAAYDSGMLRAEPGNLRPADYLDPQFGFLFRFPFPDEDDLEFGDIGEHEHDRGLLVEIDRGEYFPYGSFPDVKQGNYSTVRAEVPGDWDGRVNPNSLAETVRIELVYQKLWIEDEELCLVLVYRCPYCGDMWRIPDAGKAGHVAAQIMKRYVNRGKSKEVNDFWITVVKRIILGYPGSEAITVPSFPPVSPQQLTLSY